MQKCRNAEMQKCITDAMNKRVYKHIQIQKDRTTEIKECRSPTLQKYTHFYSEAVEGNRLVSRLWEAWS